MTREVFAAGQQLLAWHKWLAMGTQIKVQALYGAQSEGPVSYLLRVNQITFLLDCGWDDAYDTSLLEPLQQASMHQAVTSSRRVLFSKLTVAKQVAQDIDVVLLSHADPQHIGALPYVVARLGVRAPIYATLPVYKMGQMFLYDQCLSRQQVRSICL